MSSKEYLLRKSAVFQMGLLFNQQPPDERISAYATALMKYEPEQIVYAFNQVINSGTAFFPSLAEILRHLRPTVEASQDKAPRVATEMLQALRWYGPHDEERMLNNVSEEARQTFLRLGFTGDIRNSENIDTVRAQLERLARSVLSSVAAEKKNEKLESIGIDTGKVLQLRKPDFTNLLPSDPA